MTRNNDGIGSKALVKETVNGSLESSGRGTRVVHRTSKSTDVLAFIKEHIGRMSALEIALALADQFPDGAQHITMAEIARMKREKGKSNGH